MFHLPSIREDVEIAVTGEHEAWIRTILDGLEKAISTAVNFDVETDSLEEVVEPLCKLKTHLLEDEELEFDFRMAARRMGKLYVLNGLDNFSVPAEEYVYLLNARSDEELREREEDVAWSQHRPQ